MWIALTEATYWETALVPNASPPVVVGRLGWHGLSPISDIKMYDASTKSWTNIASLPSARSRAGVAAVNSNAIIVIGGCTKADSVSSALSSSLATVEPGQAQLM